MDVFGPFTCQPANRWCVIGLVELDGKVDTVGTISRLELSTNCKPDSGKLNSHSHGSDSEALSEIFLASSLRFIAIMRETSSTARIDD